MPRYTFGYLRIATAALGLVAWFALAAPSGAGAGNTISTTLDVITPVSLGGTAVAPGIYTVTADDTKVTLVRDGKQVAEAQVAWKDSAQKAKFTNMLAESGNVKEIHFGGKTRYVQIAD